MKGGDMLTIYIQKVLDTAEGESQIGLSMGQYADHLHTESNGHCRRGELNRTEHGAVC